MKQILELLPIALFFIAYKMSGETISIGPWSHELNGLFSATGILIAATLIQAAVIFAIYKRLERKEIWMVLAVVSFGSLTLIFRNELFIQWKPTIFNWVLAIVFIATPLLTGKTLIERALGSQMQLPPAIWKRLNNWWSAYFTLVGAANIYVAYSYSESFWVSYKLYSAIGFTVFLSVLTVVILAPHLKDDSKEEEI